MPPRRRRPEPRQDLIFDLAGVPPARDASKLRATVGSVWTASKARFIQRYLRTFVFVTHHGTYIDGFAGPQDETLDTWAARLVLESEPRWFRNFHFFELDPAKVALLEQLRDTQPAKPKRRIEVRPGDINRRVKEILTPETIKETEATFCLLDQRTFECEWSTVAALAAHKKVGTKIEIFYFLANWWIDRALRSSKTPEALERIRLWWGRDDWARVAAMARARRLEVMLDRFRRELGYRWVNPWPIYEERSGRRIMYYMIHATDHPLAPALMRRAYQSAVDPLEPAHQLTIELGAFGAGGGHQHD